jgi:hypothetical protein
MTNDPTPCQHQNVRRLYIRGPRSTGSPYEADANRCLDCRALLELNAIQSKAGANEPGPALEARPSGA